MIDFVKSEKLSIQRVPHTDRPLTTLSDKNDISNDVTGFTPVYDEKAVRCENTG